MGRAPTQSHPTSAAAVQRLMLNLSAVSRLSLSVVLPEKEAERQASYLVFFTQRPVPNVSGSTFT